MQLNERKRELYTETALGMKLWQASLLFFVENIILLLSGIFIGTILGSFFMQKIVVYLTKVSQIPPYEVIIPWNVILETYTALVILEIVSAVVPAYYVSKQDISKSFITET